MLVTIFQFFVLDVVVNFMRLSYDNLYTQLKRIVKLAEEGEEEAHGEKVGILTSADRDFWATSRMKLMEGKSKNELGPFHLRSYDTFRNLSLIFLKFYKRKEHNTVIFKTT